MKKIRVAELFAGIGGFLDGIKQAVGEENIEVVFASEIDKYASKGYEIMHGHKPSGDITKIESKDIPDFDLLVGGSPCQSFSIAGKRGGFSDTRGTLFYEYARIVNDKRPKFFIYENVKGLVNHDKGNTFKTMVNTFEDIGYKINYQIVNSKYHGVPQNRERIFIVGSRDHSFDYAFPENQPLTLALKDILEHSVDEKFYLSDEQLAKFKPKTKKKESDIKIKARAYQGVYEKERRTEHQLFDIEGISPTVSCFEANKIHIEPKIQVDGYIDNKHKDKGTYNVLNENGISSTLLASDYKMPKMIVEPKIQKAGDLEGYKHEASNRIYETEGISPTVTLKETKIIEPKIQIEGKCGHINGHEPLKNVYSTEGISPTIDTMQGDNRQPKIIIDGTVGEYQDQLVMNPEGISKCILSGNPKKYISEKNFRIRKLTPLECLRLQGFSDDYYYKLKEHGISNSQIYKMAGNAVTTKVIKALVENLKLGENNEIS